MNAPGMDMKKIVDERVEVAAKPENVAAYQRIMNNMNNPATRLHYNTLRRLPMIKAPTLVLWGSNDQTNALELGQKTAELVPNSKLVVLDGIGHMVPNEAPDQFTRALLDFLD
jgi:pimeloyl-ACP methyl ester carboxylesterase